MAEDESRPRTFSMTTHWGFNFSMAVAMWDQRPERVPGARPARLPTVDTSWQGKPPIRMSTGSTCDQLILVMSPRFGASGQWWAKTLATGSLISENQTVSPPKTCSTARSRPPYPEKSEPILSGLAGSVGVSCMNAPADGMIPGQDSREPCRRAGHLSGAPPRRADLSSRSPAKPSSPSITNVRSRQPALRQLFTPPASLS